jgi:hypothetical protein
MIPARLSPTPGNTGPPPPPPSLIIGKRDTVARDVDAHIRAAWGSEIVSFR